MQLVGAFAVHARDWSLLCFSIISPNPCEWRMQKMLGFSKLKTWFSHFETGIVQCKARVLFWFCLVPQRSFSLPDLSWKIEGPLFAPRYKLINNNFFKDRSFWWNLVLHMHILINPVRVTLTKKVTFWGKIKCTANFAVYVLLFDD